MLIFTVKYNSLKYYVTALFIIFVRRQNVEKFTNTLQYLKLLKNILNLLWPKYRLLDNSKQEILRAKKTTSEHTKNFKEFLFEWLLKTRLWLIR